jgi:ABC-2 type transport system ATP-binding protein
MFETFGPTTPRIHLEGLSICEKVVDVTIADDRPGGIVLSHLTKSFGDVQAVRSIDLTIATGEIVALLGPNGAGKTTTIDMVLGLSQPDKGSVTLFGMTPANAVKAGLIGGMLQTGTPVQYLSVRELITMMASIYPHPLDVDEVLHLTGTFEFAERPTTKLSGGQTQRVRFAVALVADPDLLVLDEPTAAIDVEGRRDFWNIMRKVAAQGKTVIFATHYLEEADAFADRIVLMARGRIVADGPPTEIKARVGGRVIRATLLDVATSELSTIVGVTNAERRGDAVTLACADSDSSDRALRELLARYPGARDLEVRGVGLEEAFLELTADNDEDADDGLGFSDDGTKGHGLG